MSEREVVRAVFAGQRPPYVPWSFGFTQEAREKPAAHYGVQDLEYERAWTLRGIL